MKELWGNQIYFDPAYSPNLKSDGGSFKLAKTPKQKAFWKE